MDGDLCVMGEGVLSVIRSLFTCCNTKIDYGAVFLALIGIQFAARTATYGLVYEMEIALKDGLNK